MDLVLENGNKYISMYSFFNKEDTFGVLFLLSNVEMISITIK